MRALPAAALLAALAAWVVAAWVPAPPAAAQGDPAAVPVQTELGSVEGAANPLDAPLLGPGAVEDTIVQPEVLWYAVDAAPGQRIRASARVLGRPGDEAVDGTALAVGLTDPQRQPVAEEEVPFDGVTDAVVDLPVVDVPLIDGGRPLLSVALSGVDTLAGTAYRLHLTVAVEGEPVPLPSETHPSAAPQPAPAPTVRVTQPPTAEPAEPAVVRDVAPWALIALAVGGVAGFELSRRGL